jgi:hypothetical protein
LFASVEFSVFICAIGGLNQPALRLWTHTVFPSGSNTMAMRHTGVSIGSIRNFTFCARRQALPPSPPLQREWTSRAIAHGAPAGWRAEDGRNGMLCCGRFDSPSEFQRNCGHQSWVAKKQCLESI